MFCWTPGHTLDHVSYIFDNEKALFAADTLFSIGCGRVFEGNYPMMWDLLRLKLRALPDDFKLYCGHEYTAANIKFALTVEPDNAALKARAEQVTRLRAENKPTIPTLLGEEKKANVFLRADEPSVAASVRIKGRSAAEVFGELRERRTSPDGRVRGSSAAAADIIARLDSSRIPRAGIFARPFATISSTPMDAPFPPRSISCWRAASGRTGIASMRSRSGIITPAPP